MSWLFSQVLVEEYLEDTCSDGEPFVPLNGNHTQPAYLPPDKMTKFSRLSQFGMTFKPLTESRGEELLTLYLVGFRAKTSVQQGKEPELTDNEAECGVKWQGLLAKLDRNTHLWRTVQCSLLEDLNESLQIFPRSGMTANGLLWELPMLAHRIKETESGSVPDGVTFFHTPNTTGLDGGSNSRKALKKRMEQNWPTPTAHNAKETNAPSEALRNEPTLASRVGGKLNPTWVEWLMGWPLGWTDLKPLETDKFHCVQQLHGDC